MFDHLVGKTIEYDFGGSASIVLNVTKVEKYTHCLQVDGEWVQFPTYSVSEDGRAFYGITENNFKIVVDILVR